MNIKPNIKEVCKLNDSFIYQKTFSKKEKLFLKVIPVGISIIAVCVLVAVLIIIL